MWPTQDDKFKSNFIYCQFRCRHVQNGHSRSGTFVEHWHYIHRRYALQLTSVWRPVPSAPTLPLERLAANGNKGVDCRLHNLFRPPGVYHRQLSGRRFIGQLQWVFATYAFKIRHSVSQFPCHPSCRDRFLP